MTNRINHVKLITPVPEVVDAFLREVCDIPEGWSLNPAQGDERLPADARLGPGGDLPDGALGDRRRVTGTKGFIAGTPESRQFQILEGEPAAFWAICISTRHIEDVYERCQQRGVPCTPITVADWNERDNIRNFFCVVGGLMFEVIRVEPK
jgi:hypothetical protein